MFKPIPKQNITLRPYKVYKNYTFTSSSFKWDTIRNLTGSYDEYESYLVSGSGISINEYTLNKSVRNLFYNNHPKLVGTITNWDYSKYANKKLFTYEVTSSAGLTTYRYFYDSTASVYIDEFQNFLNENNYRVNSNGQVYSGTYSDVTKMYGTMYEYGSLDERNIGDRFFLLQVSQSYVGEGINPGSLTIQHTNTGHVFRDDGYSNLVTGSNEQVVGNVFYSQGIITFTYLTDKLTDTYYNFGSSDFLLKYQSSKTIYENEVLLEVNQNEFNVSTNPSATTFYNGAAYVNSLITLPGTGSSTSDRVLDFRIVSNYNKTSKIGFNDYEYSSSMDPTGSYLAPYVTTVGLYDEYYNLVAVAKIPSKPKSTPDYPLNFIIRFDT